MDNCVCGGGGTCEEPLLTMGVMEAILLLVEVPRGTFSDIDNKPTFSRASDVYGLSLESTAHQPTQL